MGWESVDPALDGCDEFRLLFLEKGVAGGSLKRIGPGDLLSSRVVAARSASVKTHRYFVISSGTDVIEGVWYRLADEAEVFNYDTMSNLNLESLIIYVLLGHFRLLENCRLTT